MAEPKAAAKRERKASTPSAPFTLSLGIVAAVLALLTVMFFHEVALGGKTFVSPDGNAPAGFVRVGEQSLWHDHVYPLWNPFVFLGMPSFGSGAYNPLMYPPDWPLALVKNIVPPMTWLLLYYFLGGLFLYLLAKEWGARSEAALLGAVAFVFTPNLVAVGAYGHGSQLVDTAYIPLMVWLAARWLRRGSLADLGWLAFAGGFQFLRGHLQICVYTWMAIGMYAGIELLAGLRAPATLGPKVLRALALGAAAGLAFGFGGVYNLPLKDYSHYSIRGTGDAGGGVGIAYATGWSMAPYEMLCTVIPNAVGFGGGTYWGAMPFTEYPNAFIGIVAALLALLAFAGPRGASRVFVLVLAVFSVLVSFGSHFPLYGFLYEHFPQFNKFRVPVMIIILFQFAAALAAAWGWGEVLARAGAKKKDAGFERLLFVLGGVLLVAGAVALVGQDALRGTYVASAMAHKPGFPAEAANAAYAGFVVDLGRAAFLGLGVIVLAWLALRGTLKPLAASGLLLALLLFDLWPVSAHVMEPVIGEVSAGTLDAGRDDVVDWLAQQGPWGSFRVLPFDDMQSNRYAGWGVATVGGMHAAKPRLFQDLMDTQALSSPRFWELLNVRYVTISRPLGPDQVPPFLKSVYSGSATVYENLLALPRATVVGAYAVLPDTGRAAIDSIKVGTHDPGGFTWLVKDPGVKLGPVEGATARVEKYGLHDVQIAVRTPGAAIVRLSDLWYPDWKVTVDGKPAEMLRADHLLRAVVVPAGDHRVAFTFASPSVRKGLAVSLVSFGISLALLLLGLVIDRRTRGTAGGAAAASAAAAAAAAGVL